jgi:S1-C subfamily serine protease
VAEVLPGTPADDAGLRSGDIITTVDGTQLDADSTLQGVLRDYAPGDEVTLSVLRDGTEQQVRVTLAAREDVS